MVYRMFVFSTTEGLCSRIPLADAELERDADQDAGFDRGDDRASLQPTMAADDHQRDRV